MLRVMNDDLRMFLNDRMEANGVDAEMCYRIVARQDTSDVSVPNYFMAIPNPQDAKRAVISQTSLAALDKAGITLRQTRELWNPLGGHRQNIRPGRWVRAMSGCEDGNINDVFVMALDARFGVGDVPVELLSGKDIGTHYNARKHCHCESLGDLANSCMRYDYGDGFFAIYEKLAHLAVIRCPQCKGIRARAVAWDTDGKKYVDRRYGTQQNKQALLSFLTKEGYVDVWPGSVGSEHKTAFSLAFPALPADLTAAPYLDSLIYWCRTCQTLGNRGGACSKAKHDLAVLRGQNGTNHQGWYGLCPDCGSPLDHRRRCPNLRTCPGCDASWCGGSAKCPNACVRCTSCSAYRKKDVLACPNGCIDCPTCGTGNRKTYLNQTHGQCRQCGATVTTSEVVEYRLKLTRDRYDNLTTRCPGCDWRIVMKEYSRLGGLQKCEHVHNGPYGYEGGHCSSCHAYIVLEAPPEKKASTPPPTYGQMFTKTKSPFSDMYYSHREYYLREIERRQR